MRLIFDSYFINGKYAGISAFVNEPAPEEERYAQMLACGVLVPLDGRMGKSWLHAENLKRLARYVAQKRVGGLLSRCPEYLCTYPNTKLRSLTYASSRLVWLVSNLQGRSRAGH